MQKKVTETHPLSGLVKKTQTGRGQTSEIDNLYNTFSCFPEAQSSQSRANMEAEMGSAGTQNHDKSAKRAPQKTLTKKHEKLDRVSILMLKTEYFFAAFWFPFRALGRPGAKLVREPPPRAPGMVPDPTFNDFSWFLDGFLVAFCARPLVCHHFFGKKDQP